MIRPANYMAGNPGRGHTVVEADGMRVGVINLSGQVQLRVARSPFDEVDALLDRLEARPTPFFVDFHAEVTSEKVAMGWHLDGRVAAVSAPTPTCRPPTRRVLPRGTAFISDVGMTGSRTSVLGVRREQALEGFRTQMPVRFETAEEDVWVMARPGRGRPDGLARSIEQVLVPAPDSVDSRGAPARHRRRQRDQQQRP